MNKESDQTDKWLGECLQSWQVKETLPPRFEEQVWRRIDHAEPAGLAGLWEAIQNLVAALPMRRAWAVSYLVVALAVGMSLGYLRAERETNHLTASLGQQYLQSLDPYQKPRH